MKHALILHGTDCKPTDAWFPWLEDKLKLAGYNVWVPSLPGNHTPNYKVYNDYLFAQDWEFEDNIIIGHSSGAVSVLNLLMDERCPRVKLAVMVGAWAGGQPNGHFEPDQFKDLFPEGGFDFELIKWQAEHLEFLHSDNDPYCPLEQAQYLAKQLDAPLTLIPGGKHLSKDFPEFPQLWNIIEPKL